MWWYTRSCNLNLQYCSMRLACATCGGVFINTHFLSSPLSIAFHPPPFKGGGCFNKLHNYNGSRHHIFFKIFALNSAFNLSLPVSLNYIFHNVHHLNHSLLHDYRNTIIGNIIVGCRTLSVQINEKKSCNGGESSGSLF